MKTSTKTIGRAALLATAAVFGIAGATGAQAATTIKPYFEFKQGPMIKIAGDLSTDTNGKAAPVANAGPNYVFGFEGVSQYDGAAFARNFIPPDTMGSVGMTQYMETSNGAYAVFDKATGNRLALMSDVQFWAGAGQVGANGDSRVMYNAQAQRWIAISFGASTSDIQIAISDTDNALGGWKSTKFTGFAGGVADYPTLALDTNAVYIGTNNFTASFQGTTMNVIPLASLFNAVAPTTTNMKQFVTPLASGVDRGFAQQGVNSTTPGTEGKVIAASLFEFDNIGFKVQGLTSTSATAATVTAPVYTMEAAFTTAGAGRQPAAAIPANRRVVATLDERISSSVYEANGLIYAVHTVNDTADGRDEARIRYVVMDANTFEIVDQGNIGEAGYDYYQGSIAVNSKGQVVIGYNRSGLQTADADGDGFSDGNITLMARVFKTVTGGKLVQTSDELKLKVSLTDDYHNGSIFGQNAAGRQRWGDYSQVSIDPTNESTFWVIGEFAREYNLPQFGHPGGTGGSRWGTWIAKIYAGQASVPEPASWALMLAGFGLIGGALRRQRRVSVSYAS